MALYQLLLIKSTKIIISQPIVDQTEPNLKFSHNITLWTYHLVYSVLLYQSGKPLEGVPVYCQASRFIIIFQFLLSWLAVNVLWHKWHWNDLSSTLHDEHLYGWKIHIFFNYLLQKLTCSKCVVAKVTLEWLVFHSPWWSLVCMKKPNIFQVLVAKVDLQ